MTPPNDPPVHHLWNGSVKHGKISPYGSPSPFANATSDATKALEKMCELSKLQDEPRSVLAPSSGRHSAWQSHWLNKGADQTKDVLKCVWCKMSFPTLQAMSAHMAETKHGTAAAQSLQPPPPPPPPPASASASSGHKNDLNMLIKETMPLPRKLVRGQDVWLGKGAEQTRQILKCMWCGQSFRSLQEMTTHMQQTQHYTNIISQEQIISWKSADENKSSGSGSGGGGSSNTASTSSPVGSATNASSANHVSAVLTCKVCDQAFNSLKELSVHMVKNSHYKEHMMRSITEGSNRRRQTREKRKKSLPVRKLLELERAQHEVKNGDGSGGYATGFKTAGNETAANHHHHHHHRLGRIICEKCGEKVDVAGFMEHLRVCVTMTADQKNLLKTALMSQNTLSTAEHQSGGRGDKRSKKEQLDRCQDLSVNKSASTAANTAGSSSSSTSSPSVLNAIEKLIEKSFDSRLRYGASAAGASIGESILKRLGIDESVDATKPIMDMQAMNLLRSYQSLGRHERSGSESSSMSPELAAMRSDSTTPDRKYESAADYQRVRSVTPKSTPERHHSPKSSCSSTVGGGNKNNGVVPPPETVGVEAKSGEVTGDAAEETAGGRGGGMEFEVKKEYVDDDEASSSAAAKSPEEQRARSRESAEDERSSRGATPTNVVKSEPPSPAGSDKSAATDGGGKKTPVATTSSLGALSSMFESLTSVANGGGSSSTTNGDNVGGGCGGSGGKSGGGASSHPLAALQKLCDKTENHHHPHHHRPSSRSSSNASATNGAAGPAQSMSPPASVTGGTTPGAILAFSWACNDAVVTADSIMKCAFCDTPFISKGAYRHHLSKVHFVKEGITPEPIMLKSASAVAAAAVVTTGHQPSPSSSTSVTAHSPSPSPSSSSQNKSSPNHNNNNNNNINSNNNNNNNGSPSTSAAGGAKSPETKNGGYDESPHSKFLKYTELAKQLSSKYV